jgi:hypothetical protein
MVAGRKRLEPQSMQFGGWVGSASRAEPELPNRSAILVAARLAATTAGSGGLHLLCLAADGTAISGRKALPQRDNRNLQVRGRGGQVGPTDGKLYIVLPASRRKLQDQIRLLSRVARPVNPWSFPAIFSESHLRLSCGISSLPIRGILQLDCFAWKPKIRSNQCPNLTVSGRLPGALNSLRCLY